MGTRPTVTQPSAGAFAGLEAAFAEACRRGGPTEQADYLVGGRGLRVRAVGAELAALLAAALLPALDTRPPALALDLWDVSQTGVAGPHDRRSDQIEERRGSAGERSAQTPDAAYARCAGPDFAILHSRGRRRAVGWVGDPTRLSRWNRVRPWEALIIPWLGGLGTTVLHSALVSRGGRGVLIPGANGVGKSTAAAACAAAGFDYHGDDAVAVESADRGGRFAGHCLYAVIKFDRRLLAHVPILAPHASPYGDPMTDEVVVRLPGSPAIRCRASAEIVAMAMPSLSDRTATRFAAVRPGRALLALLGCQLSAPAGGMAGQFALLAALAQQAPAFRLELGRDPASIPSAVDAILGQVSA